MLEVRRFAAGDARAIRALGDAAMSAGGASARGDEEVDLIAAAYVADGGDFLLGVCDGRLVAMGALRHVTDAVAELNRMRVHPGSSAADSAERSSSASSTARANSATSSCALTRPSR